MEAQLHPQEVQRLQALCRYDILDTPREPAFDAIVNLVSTLCKAPVSVVNLIDDGRQWFKAEVGLGVRETPIQSSICAHAILQEDLFVVEDTTLDPRFSDNPLVTGDPYLRFYAGKLLVSSDGYPLGTLCVLDYETRTLSSEQRQALETLGKHVMYLLELRVAMKRQDELSVELEAALESHKRLLGVVSHDLRAPLNVVQLCADTLELSAGVEIDTHTVSKQLKRACHSMTGLVTDLIDFESIRKGSLSLSFATHKIGDILKETVEQYAASADSAGIRLSTDFDASLPPVRCDAARIKQVLVNLIQNGIKFTPAGGTVTLGAQSRGKEVAVSVRDSGCGIARGDQPYVFEPHWRGNDPRSGTGLGLSIVKSLVAAHGGDVKLISSLGNGCLIEFTLPHETTRAQ